MRDIGADLVVQSGGVSEVQGDIGEVALADVAGEGGRVTGSNNAGRGAAGGGTAGQHDVAGGGPALPLRAGRQVVAGRARVLDEQVAAAVVGQWAGRSR